MCALHQFLVRFAGGAGHVIDEREHATLAPLRVLRLALLELGEDVVGRATDAGDGAHSFASTESVKMLFDPLPLKFDGGDVVESVTVGIR